MKITTLCNSSLAVILLAAPTFASADAWSCRHDNDVREIIIQRDTDQPVPCSIVYKKLTEGVEDQVLWTANNDASFCEQKAREFVAKQESWGWTCVETIQQNNEAEAAPAEPAAPAVE